MNYLLWRFSGGFASYFKFAGRIMAYLAHIFAVRLMFRTLFWPWKRDITPPRSQGFDVKEWFNRHFLNFFARVIGFLIKLFTLILWLLLEILWMSAFLVFFPVWAAAPLVFLILMYYLFISVLQITNGTSKEWLDLAVQFAIYLFPAVLLCITELKVKKSWKLSKLLATDIKNPDPQSPWFQSICAHLLINPNDLQEAWGNDKLKKILLNSRLSREEFDKLINLEIAKQTENTRKKCWWLRDNLMSRRPFTEDWVFGWTFNLNRFSSPLKSAPGHLIAKTNLQELMVLKNILAENEGANVVIVGEVGTGRQRLLQNLISDIRNRDVPAGLIGKRILEFHLDSLIASNDIPGDKVLLVEKALLEAAGAGNIILFIPSLQNYLGTAGAQENLGQTDISAILSTFLEKTNLQIITAATPEEIHQVLRAKPQLTKYIQLIKLEEPSLEECLVILADKGQELEQKFGKLITYGAIKKASEISYRYLQNQAMPKRALNFLEETINFLHNNNPADHIIKEGDIELFASQKIKQSIGAIQDGEKKQLLELEKEMQNRIVGQREAINATVSALRRRRLDLSSPERPAGCFLFLGPTGVGKTHTAETLAKLYFREEDRMARLDMSEYQENDAITKLLGDAAGKIEGYFHKVLSRDPFSLILLDELEKASREVHQLLLQIMEEGIAKTGTGVKLNFRETIIIATSNAEALLIQKLIKEKESYEAIQKNVVDRIQKDGIFSPELLNRFNEIIVFHPLEPADLVEVAKLALEDLRERLEEKEILISYDSAFQQKLAKKGYDPIFGARELRRVLEKQVEDAIAKDMLAGKIKKGEEFTLPIEYLN